jgi:hypothetical protein
MGQEIAARMASQYPELSTYFDQYNHTTPLGVETRRLCLLADVNPAELPFPATSNAILFFSRARERVIVDQLKAARRKNIERSIRNSEAR